MTLAVECDVKQPINPSPLALIYQGATSIPDTLPLVSDKGDTNVFNWTNLLKTLHVYWEGPASPTTRTRQCAHVPKLLKEM